VSILFILWPI